VSAAARADGLVDVRTVVPDALVDLRYATTDNFTHVQLYPARARCLVHRTMEPGLRTAANVLRRQGYLLVFWDCYRPHSVQERMWQVVPNPNWVARPGAYARSHEAGRSVDVTIALRASTSHCAASVQRHCLADMGTGFDDFTPRAYAFTTAGLTPTEIANRIRLRHAMAAGGLTVYAGEWWHFDGPGWDVPRPILAAPVY
jgi:D-alanyl-D-alanine dipeptidase